MNLMLRQQSSLRAPNLGWPWAASGGALLSVMPLALAGIFPASTLGLALAAITCVSLALALATVRGRAALLSLTGYRVAAAGMGLGLIAIALAMTPWPPGGVHPLWAPVGAGAAVLDEQSALSGLLALGGLAALFLVSAILGTASERARQAVSILQGLLVAIQVSVVATDVAFTHRSATDVPASSAFVVLTAGLNLVLAIAATVQAWKMERPRRWVGRLTTAAWPITVAVISCLLVVILGGVQAAACAGCAAAMFIAWEFLARGGVGSLRSGPLLLATGLAAAALIALTTLILLATAPAATAPQAVSNAVHTRAVLASPWLGYGPGSTDAVARLSMDRLNLSAMQVRPLPASGYLLSLEQGGVLTAAPMAAALLAVVWALVEASVLRRRLTTLFRAVVCCALFCALFAAISAAPATVCGAAPMVFLLGCGFGAARSR